MAAGMEVGMAAGTAGMAVGGTEAGGMAVTGIVGVGGRVTAGVGGVGAVGTPIRPGVNIRTVTTMAAVTAAAVAVAPMAILLVQVMRPRPSSLGLLTSVTIMARSTERLVPKPKALSKLSKPTGA